jgi:hypothetical protein
MQRCSIAAMPQSMIDQVSSRRFLDRLTAVRDIDFVGGTTSRA